MEIGASVFSGGGDQSQSDSESDTDSVKMSRDKEPEKGSRSRSTDRVSRERSNSVDLEEDSIIEESVIRRVESLIGGREREAEKEDSLLYHNWSRGHDPGRNLLSDPEDDVGDDNNYGSFEFMDRRPVEANSREGSPVTVGSGRPEGVGVGVAVGGNNNNITEEMDRLAEMVAQKVVVKMTEKETREKEKINTEKVWEEGMEFMVCKACTTHGKDLDIPREFVKYGFGGGKTSGVIGKLSISGEIKPVWQIKQAMRRHCDNSLHKWCARKAEEEKIVNKTFEEENKTVAFNVIQAYLKKV